VIQGDHAGPLAEGRITKFKVKKNNSGFVRTERRTLVAPALYSKKEAPIVGEMDGGALKGVIR